VRDWGIGFDPAQVGGGHFGLKGIHERARLLGGFVALQTGPQQGTRISIELPLLAQAENGTAAFGLGS
jgi:signal transduction histidine kinase